MGSLDYNLLVLIGSLLSAEFAIVLWLNNLINKVRSEITKSKDEILAKLEYHERHDDKRFAQVQDALWNLKFSIRDTKEKKND